MVGRRGVTIPWRMNCAHLDDGWCLDCVRNLVESGEALAQIAAEYVPAITEFPAEYNETVERWQKAQCGLPYQGPTNNPCTPTKCDPDSLYPDESASPFANVSSCISGSVKFVHTRVYECRQCGKRWTRKVFGMHGHEPHVCWEPMEWG